MRDLQAAIERLAEQLQRAVAVDDPFIRLLAHTAHFEEVDEHRIHSILKLRASANVVEYLDGLGIHRATEPMRVPSNPALGMLGRLCVPVRCGGHLLGFLWLIDDAETLTEREVQASVATAELVGELLFRERMCDDVRRSSEQRVLLKLILSDSDGDVSVDQSDLEAVGLTDELACRLLAVHAPFVEASLDSKAGELCLESVLRTAVGRIRNVYGLVATRSDGLGYVLVAFHEHHDPLDELRSVGSRVRDELLGTLPGASEVVVGIGSTAPGVRAASLSLQRAHRVVDVCRKVPGFSPIAAWEDLGVYRVLEQLTADQAVEATIPPGLRRLLASGSDLRLVETLDTYLDAAGNAQESAKRLNIHRATLYYRLARVEAITGMSLADGQDRLALHLGVKLGWLTGTRARTAVDTPVDAGIRSNAS